MHPRYSKARKSKGLTQKQVAEYLHISRTTYTQYEIGVNAPNPETLIKMADLFDVSVDYLLGHTVVCQNGVSPIQNESSNEKNCFAEQLIMLRKVNCISQQTLSKILEISQQAVAKWEKRKSSPDPDTLLRIANYFNVSTDYLLGHSSVPAANNFSLSTDVGSDTINELQMEFAEIKKVMLQMEKTLNNLK